MDDPSLTQRRESRAMTFIETSECGRYLRHGASLNNSLAKVNTSMHSAFIRTIHDPIVDMFFAHRNQASRMVAGEVSGHRTIGTSRPDQLYSCGNADGIHGFSNW